MVSEQAQALRYQSYDQPVPSASLLVLAKVPEPHRARLVRLVATTLVGGHLINGTRMPQGKRKGLPLFTVAELLELFIMK